jgi:redox-sensitive bicupin YhaK (pirin superfamily)
VSGPVSTEDVPAVADADAAVICEIEVVEGRAADVGGFRVHRVLPRRARRTVGAWCFVDQMGPATVTTSRGLDIGPHPHIGLQTVTWLLRGEVLHRDSLGSEQTIRPGQLNLMTAGAGISHAEETAGVYEGELHGVQLWIAQPDRTRNDGPEFEHHAELPQTELDGAVATVLVGDLAGVGSPARRDTEHLGADLVLRAGSVTLPLDGAFEHALVVLDGSLSVGSIVLAPGHLGYLGVGREEVRITTVEPCRALLIGGAPFVEPLLMWWNYVARDRDEISAAHRQWTDAHERFGRVASPLARIDTGGPPWADTTR